MLAGRIPVVARVHRASDIEVALSLAEDYGLDLVISGASEAWMVADRLAAARFRSFSIPSTTSLRPSTGSVPPWRMHPTSRGGCSDRLLHRRDPQRSQHETTGRQCGRKRTPLRSRVGSDHPESSENLRTPERRRIDCARMAADVVIWDGDPLELSTFAEQVIIGGRLIPMVSRSTLLRDRYLELETDIPLQYAE